MIHMMHMFYLLTPSIVSAHHIQIAKPVPEQTFSAVIIANRRLGANCQRTTEHDQ